MPHLQVYVPENIAKKADRLAREQGPSVSKFLAELLERELDPGWPDGYFEDVIGSWQGDPLERQPQGELETRDSLRA